RAALARVDRVHRRSGRRQASVIDPPPGCRGVMSAVLTADDEVALARRIERGDPKAKEKLIESNLGLVHLVARGYRGGAVPFTDLIQEGTVGLVRAAERFDHRRGLKFSTYAVWWI